LALAAPDPVSDEPASGTAALANASYATSAKVEMRWIYTAGPDGLEVGDALWLEDPIFHGQRWSKWGDLSPYAEDCSELDGANGAMSWGLVSARSSTAALDVRRTNCDDAGGSCRESIYERAATVVTVVGGALAPGEQLAIVSGDMSEDDTCGFETPPRAFTNVSWEAWEQHGGGEWRALEPVPVSFEPGPPFVLAASLPSIARTGETARLRVALLDERGNPVPAGGDLALTLGALDGPATATLDGAVADVALRASEPGVYRPTVTWNGRLSAVANPMEVSDAPVNRIYWGDLHSHHGHTWWDDAGAPHDENVEYARDVVGLDVVAESQKCLPTEIDGEALWAELGETCERETVPGAFVVLSGFEWIGTTDLDPRAGHSNVYYDACDGPLGTHDRVAIPDLEGLWAWVDEVRRDTGVDALTIPHATQFTGHTFLPDDLQRSIEVFSGWGDSLQWEGDRRGSAAELLRAGAVVGFLAASDNHDGWMGNVWTVPLDGVPGAGLAAFVAPALTRPEIFAAIASRHTYATTGPRIVVHLDATVDGETFGQGSEIVSARAALEGSVHGTAPISRARLVRQAIGPSSPPEILAEAHGAGTVDPPPLEADVQGTTAAAYWLEVVQTDGHQAVTSPIFLTPDCARIADGAHDPGGSCADRIPEPARCGCSTKASPAALLLPALLAARRRRTRRARLDNGPP
jgi:hypothetical protein